MSESIIDTDILSFYFRADPKVVESVTGYLNEFDQLTISIITYYEIIGGLTFKKAEKQLRDFEEFITHNNVIHISEESARISGKIYAERNNNRNV